MKAFRDNDAVSQLLGAALLAAILPLVAFQIAVATAWELCDSKLLGAQALASWINKNVRNSLAIRDEDSFMLNVMLLNGLLLPAYFLYEGYSIAVNGFSWKRMLLYNCLRFGPNVSNFAWVNTLIHKCCHTRVFKRKALDPIFEFWVGNFYGVVPGNYCLSHVYNHHKHDNSIEDVITVIDFPRDSFLSFLGYHYRYFVYTINVSTALYFYDKGEWARCFKTVCCSVYYALFTFCAGHYFGWWFAYFYVVYPMLQGNLIIAAINYTWHAFVQPHDEQNRLINSTTIINGQYFIMEEQYHAVHHLYAGIHWTKHEQMYRKHMHECAVPTVFYDLNIFELWGMIVFANYDKLAENSKIDKDLLIARLRHVAPRRTAAPARPPSISLPGVR